MSMTVDQVADILRVSRWTVSRACQSGAFPGAHQDGANQAWTLPDISLPAFIAANTTGGTHPEDSPVELDDLRFYKIEEVAELTGIPAGWLARNCRSRSIRACKIGRTWRMTADQIRAISDHAETRTTADVELATELEYQRNRPGRRRSTTTRAA